MKTNPTTPRQRLFDYLMQDHRITALESELDEIIRLAHPCTLERETQAIEARVAQLEAHLARMVVLLENTCPASQVEITTIKSARALLNPSKP